MTEYFLESRGIAYRTNDVRPERATLLFIHGLVGSASVWYPFEQELEGRYNIISFDLRGHGLSKRWRRYRDYEIRESIEDIAKLLEHLHVEETILIGHSLGALLALAFANAYPHKGYSIIFLSPTAGLHRLVRTKMSRPLVALVNSVLRLFPIRIRNARRTDYSKFLGTKDWDPRRILADLKNTGLHSYCYFLQHIYAFKDADLWKTISVPTLIVHGALDSYIPITYARELAGTIPHARMSILPTANHILVVNNIPEILKEIEEFIQ